jgi:transposase
MPKLTLEQRKEIITAYKLDNTKENIQAICNKYNITKQYIYKLLKSDIVKDVDKSITESKQEFTKRANEIIKKLLDRIEEKALYDDKTTLSQLSTTLGILYDKSRLENNLSTSNNDVQIHIKIEK